MSHAIRIGTRRSPLARRQSQQVADLLARRLERPVSLVEVTTRGDVDPAPLAAIGGAGVFVGALRTALANGDVDLAVHSMKDLPTADAPGLRLAAVPARLDARDALVGARLTGLRPGARVGTGSPRRAAALRALGRGVEPVAIRGNIDTRIAMAGEGRLDAVVLAMAGLARLGRHDLVLDPLDPTLMPPHQVRALSRWSRATTSKVTWRRRWRPWTTLEAVQRSQRSALCWLVCRPAAAPPWVRSALSSRTRSP